MNVAVAEWSLDVRSKPNVNFQASFIICGYKPSMANNSTMIVPIPNPLSVLHSNSIFPDISLPAWNTESANFIDTFTFEW